MRSEGKLLNHPARLSRLDPSKASSSTVRSPVLQSSQLSPNYHTTKEEEKSANRYSRLDDLLPDYDVREEIETLGLLSKKRLSPKDVAAVLGKLGYTINHYQLQSLLSRERLTQKTL